MQPWYCLNYKQWVIYDYDVKHIIILLFSISVLSKMGGAEPPDIFGIPVHLFYIFIVHDNGLRLLFIG